MISFPNCKINLGLYVTAKREDGFHDLETVFYPVPIRDAIEISDSKDETRLKVTGIPVSDDHENLCFRAYELIKQDFPEIKNLQMHLHKAIPIGAGLGGGSADGAFMVQLINSFFQLNLTADQLHDYATKLGSDCPFFLINQPCIAKGRGEILEPIEVSLSGYHLVLIHPGIHINTRDAFKNILPKKPSISLLEIIKSPISEWREKLFNDFEISIFKLHPEISKLKYMLYNSGALYASMTGSGSAVYGLFEKEIKLPDINPSYFIRQVKLK